MRHFNGIIRCSPVALVVCAYVYVSRNGCLEYANLATTHSFFVFFLQIIMRCAHFSTRIIYSSLQQEQQIGKERESERAAEWERDKNKNPDSIIKTDIKKPNGTCFSYNLFVIIIIFLSSPPPRARKWNEKNMFFRWPKKRWVHGSNCSNHHLKFLRPHRNWGKSRP